MKRLLHRVRQFVFPREGEVIRNARMLYVHSMFGIPFWITPAPRQDRIVTKSEVTLAWWGRFITAACVAVPVGAVLIDRLVLR